MVYASNSGGSEALQGLARINWLGCFHSLPCSRATPETRIAPGLRRLPAAI